MKIDIKLPLLLVGIGAISLFGCDEVTINPFEEQFGDFTFYGSINADSLTNYVRVKDVESPLLVSEEDLELPTVVFEDLTSGDVSELEPLILDFNGTATLNYIIEQGLTSGRQYQLTAENSKGETSTSVATIPGFTNVSFEPAVPTECNQPITFSFDNINDNEFIRLEVGVNYQGAILWQEIKTVAVPEKVAGTSTMRVSLSANNMLVDFFPPAEAAIGLDPVDWIPTIQCSQLDDTFFRVRYYHFGQEWEVIKDLNLAFDVLESGDVDNGFGFMGAYRQGQTSFTVDRD